MPSTQGTCRASQPQERGLVIRARDPRDRRARRLTPTRAGNTLLARLASHADLHDRRIDAILGTDRDVLFGLLERLIQGLETETDHGD